MHIWTDAATVNGDSLHLLGERMRHGRISPAEAAEVLREIADVLNGMADGLAPPPGEQN